MTFDVIATGSTGNAVVINGSILIDVGVPFKSLEAVKKDLKLVLKQKKSLLLKIFLKMVYL